MPNAIPPDRYAAYPLIQAAIDEHRRARIAHAAAPSSATAAHVRRTKNIERKVRSLHAAQIYEDKVAAKVAAIRAKRYAYQHARKSRTSDQAISIRSTRAQRRVDASMASAAKREVNAINAPFHVPTDA